jgi:ATP-dependent DNA helicase 2 subunit 1
MFLTIATVYALINILQTVLLPTNLDVDDEGEDGSILPESISLTRIEDLLAQMRFHEVPKRAMFTSTLKLGEGFIIGVKG